MYECVCLLRVVLPVDTLQIGLGDMSSLRSDCEEAEVREPHGLNTNKDRKQFLKLLDVTGFQVTSDLSGRQDSWNAHHLESRKTRMSSSATTILPPELYNSLFVVGMGVSIGWAFAQLIHWIRLSQLYQAIQNKQVTRVDSASDFLIENEFISFRHVSEIIRESPIRAKDLAWKPVRQIKPSVYIHTSSIKVNAETKTLSLTISAASSISVQALVRVECSSISALLDKFRTEKLRRQRSRSVSAINNDVTTPDTRGNGGSMWNRLLKHSESLSSTTQIFEASNCIRVSIDLPVWEPTQPNKIAVLIGITEISLERCSKKAEFGRRGLHQLVLVDGEVACVHSHIVADSTYVVELHDMYGSDTTTSDCSVCLSEFIDVVILPCRHFQVCHSCVEHIDRCPVCRTEITMVVQFKTDDGEDDRLIGSEQQNTSHEAGD